MTKAKLTRLFEGDRAGNLRTQETIGAFSVIPTKGKRFELIGAPLDIKSAQMEFDFRLISTSKVDHVVFIEKNNEYRFTTESGSVYLLELLDKKDENVAV